MVIIDIEDEVHMNDPGWDLPEIILVIPEKAFGHSLVNPEILSECCSLSVFMRMPRFSGAGLCWNPRNSPLIAHRGYRLSMPALPPLWHPLSNYSREDNSNIIVKRMAGSGTGIVPSVNRHFAIC
jgi:hypothetical protein